MNSKLRNPQDQVSIRLKTQIHNYLSTTEKMSLAIMVESKLNSTLKTGLVLMMSTAFSAMIQNKLQLRANINFLKTSSLDLVIMNLLKRTLSLLKKVLQKLSTINSTAADHKSSLLDQDITMLTKALTPMLRRSLLLPSAANHQFKHMHPDQAPTIIARQTL